MIKQYNVFISVLIMVIILFLACGLLADQYYQYLEAKQYKNFNQGLSTYTPIKNNLPWEINVVYNDINNFAPKNNLILIGASTTREGILPDQIYLPVNWTIHNFAIGADNIYSNILMINYINGYGNHKPDTSDVVSIHIFYGSFKEEQAERDYLRQIIEKTGTYHVDASGNVQGSEILPLKIGDLKIYEISSVITRITGIDKDSLGGSIYQKMQSLVERKRSYIGIQNASDTINSETQKIETYKKTWAEATENISYPSNSTTNFKMLVKKLNSQTHVVVVNIYVPSWLRDSDKQQEYERWVRTDLVPFLKEQDIPFLDYSDSIPDNEYGDSAHLLKAGRERYSALFNKDITSILRNTSISAGE